MSANVFSFTELNALQTPSKLIPKDRSLLPKIESLRHRMHFQLYLKKNPKVVLTEFRLILFYTSSKTSRIFSFIAIVL